MGGGGNDEATDLAVAGWSVLERPVRGPFDILPVISQPEKYGFMASENRVNRITMRQISGSAQNKKIRVDLGSESAFTDLPKLINVGAANYFLVRSEDRYKMLSTMCPHQGGDV